MVRRPDGTEIGAATLILRPEAQSRAGVVVSFEQDQVIMHKDMPYTVPGVVLEMIPETVHLENQGNPENLITVGPITWRMRTAGEQGRQFLEALNTPGASVTLTVPRGFLDTPRDLGPQMDSLATYDWANPHPPYTSPEDMARTAMNWVKSQPGRNRDLLRIIAEEIYQGYRGQENGQDNAIQAVRNFLVSVAEIEDFDDSTELDQVTGRSRVLDAVYHSLIEVARTDPRLLIAWLEQISGVDATNEQGQHVGRAVRTEQGEFVEGGYNLQAGIDTIAALAELTNYPEVLDVLKDQLSGLLKANRALEHERYLVLSHKALGKLLPELDLEGVNLFHAHLTNANLSGANLTRANLNGAILSGANLTRANLQNTSLSRANLSGANLNGAVLNGTVLEGANLTNANLNGANLAGAIMTPQTLEEINSLISKHRYQVLGLDSVILFEPNADLSDANLTGADLRGANLTNANLTNANLTNVGLIRANLTNANLRGADLREADLREADLREADLREADLTGADLSEANLNGAYLNRAILNGAILNRADLSGANLSGANLSSANLRYANLQGTNLNDTNLRGAALTGAALTGAALTGADFRGAILSSEQIQYIRSRGGILDQPQPPTPEHRLLTDPPDKEQIQAPPTNPVPRISDLLDNLPPPSPAGSTEEAVSILPNKPTPGLVIGGNTILTPEENLQLLRDLGIDPTGIRPDLLDDPTLKNLLREFRHTGDKEKARAKIAEWLKLKGVDLTPLALPPHTGDDKKQRDPEIPTNPPPFPDLSNVPDSRLPVPKEQPADPPLTQALSNLKNSDDPARLMREWSEAGDPQLIALLTFEGLQQVLAYGLGSKLLKGLPRLP